MDDVIYKTIVGGGENMEFVLSDATLDRFGDVIEPGGWDVRNFKKNPIALFGHSASFPIGTWSDIRVEGEKLLGKLTLATRGTSHRIDELIKLVEQRILRAVSVGFRPIKYEPLDPEDPYGGQRYIKQELLETSLVAVPANPAALSLARSMNLSRETISMVFGEQAAETRSTGRNAAARPDEERREMKTLAERIEDAQKELNAKRDKLAELNAAETPDLDAIEELNAQIEAVERELAARKKSETRLAGTVTKDAKDPAAPSIIRRPLGFPQKEVKGFELIVRAITARGVHAFGSGGDRTLDQVLDALYPGHEATAIVTKADQTIGTTTVAGWAAEVVQTAYADFVDALTGFSVYPVLRDNGISLSFDGVGTVSIPSRTAGGAGGSFVAEGAPIRVGRITTAATTMTAKKMGVIVPFSRELARRSTPTIESLVRQAILEDTALTLDPLLLDAVAADTARPAGLLNGVAAAATGFGGGDYLAVIEDFKALLAPFISANAADNITVVMNPAQGLSLALMQGPMGNPNWFNAISSRIRIVESTHATAGRLIALRNSDFATASGDTPEFDISEQATVHMEDTTPLEIVSAGGTVADPIRSFFQTATIGVRMLMDISWKMRRTGMVQWIDGTSW